MSHPMSHPVPTCFAALHPPPPQAAVQQLVGARGAGPGHQPGSGFMQEHLDGGDSEHSQVQGTRAPCR